LEPAHRTLPNDSRVFLWKGLIERRQGKWEESIRDLERGIELDPRNFFLLAQAAQGYQLLRRYAQAKATYDRILAFDPGDPGTKVAPAMVDLNSEGDAGPLHEIIASVQAANPAETSA